MWKIPITESVPLIITRICTIEWAVYFIATNNAEINSDIWVCFTSCSHRLADENILRVYSLRLLLFFKIKHSIKFRATWLWISGNMTLVPGDMTSGEMTFGRLDRLPLECEWYRRNNQLKEIPINASYTDVTIDRNRFLRVRELVTEQQSESLTSQVRWLVLYKKYICCTCNACTYSMNFLPSPRPVNWPMYKLCPN